MRICDYYSLGLSCVQKEVGTGIVWFSLIDKSVREMHAVVQLTRYSTEICLPHLTQPL